MPWEAYCLFMYVHLVTNYKHTGVCTAGVRETWRSLFLIGPKYTNTCHNEQLCVGLKAGIDGAGVHGVQAIWGAISSTKNWGFLLVDTKKSGLGLILAQ